MRNAGKGSSDASAARTPPAWVLAVLTLLLLFPSGVRSRAAAADDAGTACRVRAFLALAHQYEGESPDKADEAYRDAAELAPDQADIFRRWGFFLFRRKRFAEAVTALETAHGLGESDAEVARWLGLALVEVKRGDDAVSFLEQAVEAAPDDFFVRYQLGCCHFLAERYQQAITAWEEAIDLAKPDSDNAGAIRQRITEARERLGGPTDGPGKTIETERFVIHFAGESHLDLQGLTEEVLGDVFQQVTRDLGFRPPVKVEVMFYPTSEFHAATQAKTWVAGFAQGHRIKVPLRGGYKEPAKVKGLFAHELTHVVINFQTKQAAPIWIHEGLAVYQELQAAEGDPLQMRPDQRTLFDRIILRGRRTPDLATIRFGKDDEENEEILISYLVSYLAIRNLIEQHGADAVPRLLNALGAGESVPTAIKSISGLDFPAFQTAVYQWARGL